MARNARRDGSDKARGTSGARAPPTPRDDSRVRPARSRRIPRRRRRRVVNGVRVIDYSNNPPPPLTVRGMCVQRWWGAHRLDNITLCVQRCAGGLGCVHTIYHGRYTMVYLVFFFFFSVFRVAIPHPSTEMNGRGT